MKRIRQRFQRSIKRARWEKGLRLSISQGEFKSEIWECEHGIWAVYSGIKPFQEPSYLCSFTECVEYIFITAIELNINSDDLKKSILQETNFAVDRGLLPDQIFEMPPVVVQREHYDLAKNTHEKAMVESLAPQNKGIILKTKKRRSCSCC
ncbi:MAG: hypothetical protein HRU19_15275 [Pseudobacteriovorax sp.]|nr:hypothetical protein [Pseudobacteriovorax sp.]